MLASLGFDTIIVNNRRYDEESLSELFNLLFPFGVNKFIFLLDFDLSLDSFSVQFEKIQRFAKIVSNISPRGARSKIFYNLILDKGSSFNPEFNRLYSVKKARSLFLSLPLFTDTNYEVIAQDLNNMIYRMNAFPLITNFDMVVETSANIFWQKLLSVSNLGVSVDINYLFDPEKLGFAEALILNKTPLIPSVSRDIANYVGIVNEAEFFFEKIGKKKYYSICSQISRCSSKFGC